MTMQGQLAQPSNPGTFAVDRNHAHQPSLIDLMSLTDWLRFVPETLGLLVILSLLRNWTGVATAGSAIMPHLFWIPVLLMAAQYGIMGGLFAALSASILYIAIELPLQSAGQDFYQYASFAALQPCAWFAVALVLGGLRTLHMHAKSQLAEQLEDTKAAAADFAERLQDAAAEMAMLERRIAADTATTTVLLDALAATNLSSRTDLLASFADILRHGAGATSFTIYLREREAFVPCYGFEDGAQIPPTALASLPPVPENHAVGNLVTMPIAIPLRLKDAADSIGMLVCTQLLPTQLPRIAVRRLRRIGELLAKLLLACPDGPPEQDHA
jgi:hypothetical protein